MSDNSHSEFVLNRGSAILQRTYPFDKGDAISGRELITIHDWRHSRPEGAFMQIAVLTFDGFNELDSFIAAAILNRLRPKGWQAHITSPTEEVTSMNGVTVRRQKPLSFAAEADGVIVGSGVKTREIAADDALLSQLRLDPGHQLIGAQCSG